jgi:Protein of unknown function (DUF4232)
MLLGMADVDDLEARPGDVSFTLDWLAEDGALKGTLEARNVSRRRVRLTGKPQLSVLDDDGNPLDAPTVTTLELLMPGYVELDPGEAAVSRIGWAGWDGPAASGRVLISWPGGQAEVLASGPFQPAATGPATNLWSSWFTRE